MRKYSLDTTIFSQETPASFYLAGFIAADGNIYTDVDKQGKKHFDLGISLKEGDRPHLEKIKKLMGSDHKLYRRVIKNSKRNPNYRDSISYTLFVYAPELLKDLQSFGITSSKSLTYKMPEWLINHDMVKHFMLGYFDGDGSISFDLKHSNGSLRKTPQARLHIRGTQEFLTEFHHILYTNCNLSNQDKTVSKDSGIYSLQYTGNPNILNIMGFLYSDAVIYMDRKRQRYEEVCKIVDNMVS